VRKIGDFKYNTFGLRKDWMARVFREGPEFLDSQDLGPRQRDALVYYMKDFELIAGRNRDKTRLFSLLNTLFAREGIDSLHLWAVLWVNLFFNSLLFHWYALLPRGRYSRQDLIGRMTGDYGKFNRSITNGYTSIIGAFAQTPLGKELKLGIVKKAGRTREITKECGVKVPPFIILYAVSKFVRLRNRFDFSFEEVVDDPYFISSIFCYELNKARDLLLSVESPEFFTSDMDAGILRIRFEPDRSPSDVLEKFLL